MREELEAHAARHSLALQAASPSQGAAPSSRSGPLETVSGLGGMFKKNYYYGIWLKIIGERGWLHVLEPL
jgi:hypothetical protein